MYSCVTTEVYTIPQSCLVFNPRMHELARV